MDTPIFDSMTLPACGYLAFDPAAEHAFSDLCDLPLGHEGPHAVDGPVLVAS